MGKPTFPARRAGLDRPGKGQSTRRIEWLSERKKAGLIHLKSRIRGGLYNTSVAAPVVGERRCRHHEFANPQPLGKEIIMMRTHKYLLLILLLGGGLTWAGCEDERAERVEQTEDQDDLDDEVSYLIDEDSPQAGDRPAERTDR